ncbi:MAG: glycosyl hydrolase 53 family protein, partial [Lachnospiraceae bacterium]|nr:glycosyl hydrolase 53 family protein [Lachnospiraceae bacterium]
MKRLVLALAVKTLFCLTACGSANNEEVRETALPPANENPSGSDAISDKWWLSGEYAKGSIFVDAIPGLSPDFIRGADISSLLSLEESGVKFYGFDGNEQDMLKTMSEAAFNYIRVRVWNDPFDENGNGYGGGNCNAQTAAILGKRAADYGMKLLVDFHYSDFWADPGKQQAPKAWENMDINEKEKALYDYTVESLRTIIDAGADVGMVQIGNETTGGFCGEKSWPRICVLMASGARAVRAVALETGKDIEIVIHLTNPESHNFSQTARLLEVNNVDYDIFATSYYSFWHGSLENMTEKLAEIAAVYGKKVMVAEVAYAYSYEDFDGHANTIGDGATFDKQYPLTVQGQARAVYDVVEAVASLGEKGIGVFYWEPAWIPVPGDSHEERFKLWEKF